MRPASCSDLSIAFIGVALGRKLTACEIWKTLNHSTKQAQNAVGADRVFSLSTLLDLSNRIDISQDVIHSFARISELRICILLLCISYFNRQIKKYIP